MKEVVSAYLGLVPRCYARLAENVMQTMVHLRPILARRACNLRGLQRCCKNSLDGGRR